MQPKYQANLTQQQRGHLRVISTRVHSNSSVKECDCLNVETNLVERGFSHLTLDSHQEYYVAALQELREAASKMPMDFTDGVAGRARLYGRFHLHPWNPPGSDLVPEPGHLHTFNGEFGLEFTRPASVNSVAAGKRKVFKAFDDHLYNNELILDVIRGLFVRLPFDPDKKAGSFVVNVHLIKLAPQGTIEAVASPPLVHRDGEPFTAAILIDRANVKGGFNAITHRRWHDHSFQEVPREDVLDLFTLENPLEGYLVADNKVAHYVSPVGCVDPEFPAYRTILLVDFTPSQASLDLEDMVD